jgi:hypothetical protein
VDALKHLKRSNMFRSVSRSYSGSSYCSLLKSLIKTVKSQIFGVGRYVEPTSRHRKSRTHTLRYAAASPTIGLFTVLISDFNKEQYEPPEDDLETDRNMLERFKCFNATILD